ncbi:tail assembly chaperone [Pseudomonas phage PhiPA3]|uniref:Uncharacterized protein 005 n=1 Tax=Pseudomonas phage PhiPA3 TaxID=998086 RepID=F8SJN6_BPPA3|nr:tail assembly chaperone [Pseudomonas phage PhiPA3]AEH03431.1 hypothetical protein [Pseudomonas phage PhiPA3]
MSDFTRFSGDLDTTYDKAASKELGKDYWRVTTAFDYKIGSEDSNKKVSIAKGYLTDGASVPFFLWWLLPAWGEYGQAAVVHDKLCETWKIIEIVEGNEIERDIDRAECDRILYEAMRVLEVEAWRRVAIQIGVDLYRFLRRPSKPTKNKKKLQLEKGYGLPVAA